MENAKISGFQLSMVYVGFILGSSAIVNCSFMAAHDAWIAYLIGWASGFVLLGIYVYLAILNPSKTLIDMLKEYFGKYIGSLIGILYIWYFIHIASIIIRNFSEFMVTVIYTETPISFILIVFMLLLVYVLKSGFEVFVRTAELVMPILLLIILLTTLVLVREFDFNNILPTLENGVSPILSAAFRVNSFPFGETVVFLMIFPFLANRKEIKKISFLSLLITGGLLLIITLRDIFVLGEDLLQRGVYPQLISTKLFPFIDIDAFVAVDLLIAGGAKILVFVYGALIGLSQILDLEDYKIFVFPIAIIIISLSIWIYDSVFELLDWTIEIFPYYAIPFQIAIPTILLIMSLIKRWRRSESDIL